MDRLEFTEFYEANFRRVYNYISYRIDNHADADDLVSQVFMRAMEKHQSYDPARGTAEMWIISIARNAIIDHYRERAKRHHMDIDAVSPMLTSREPLPDHLIVQHEEHRRLMIALASLDERERQVVALKYGAELKNSEIARQMNLSISNTGVILFRSLLKLRRELNKEVCV